MDKFLKRKRDIDEVDAESDQNLSVKNVLLRKQNHDRLVNTMIAI